MVFQNLIKAKDADLECISIHLLVEEAKAEYTMVVSADHGGPQGRPHRGGASKMIYTKMELNNLFQNQVLAALKQFKTQQSTGKTNESFNQNKKKTNTNDKSPKKSKQ